jgi:septal ring factor EnvC (AmiA/AmiB activator)
MKEVVALIIFLVFSIFTIRLAISNKIGAKLTSIFLIFAILAGITIANHDVIKKLKWKDMEIETFERDVVRIKEKAIEELESEIKKQKESIDLLIAGANDTREKLSIQRKVVESLIGTVQETGKSVTIQQKRVGELNDQAERTKNEVEVLHKASLDLALLLVRITWLQLETKSEFGTKRVKVAIKNISDDLNRILRTIIPDEQERIKWLQDLYNSIPSKEKSP